VTKSTIAVVVGAMMPLRIGSPVCWCGAYGNGSQAVTLES